MPPNLGPKRPRLTLGRIAKQSFPRGQCRVEIHCIAMALKPRCVAVICVTIEPGSDYSAKPAACPRHWITILEWPTSEQRWSRVEQPSSAR